MKRHSGDYFKITYKNGCGGLMGQYDTVQQARHKVDESNLNAMSQGYKAETFLITFVEWYRKTDDEGMLLSTETLETAFELYGNGVQESIEV